MDSKPQQSNAASPLPDTNRAHPGRNRLQYEKSPYLLQHAANPVDWYPWSQEAFAKAWQADKPIFLSIGYSTCHWCHVMAHESFEDPDVARLMNDTFVNIKVDREERPDIDNVYMTVCQMLTRSGGWPLTIIMTPDRKPFFASTYIPKESRFGRAGMLQIIPHIRQLWQTRRKDVADSADQIVTALRQSVAPATSLSTQDSAPSTKILDQACQQLSEHFDPVYGGFGTRPKFPTPHNLLFLLRYAKRTGNAQALPMVEKTLQAMRRGGIYDQVGFGMHRYSTDQEWLVPHFEKMLYDQAMVTMAYVEAFQATSKALYAQTAREILTYVLRDMTDPAGGFHSAEDADSDGVEGKFYVWTEEQIRKVLSGRQADLFIETYNIRPDGNYHDEATGEKTGANIPHLSDPMMLQDNLIATVADPGDLAILESARRKLFEAREKRVHPGKDDKILTDWNGLMIAALGKAAAALDEPEYVQAARRAAEFVLTRLRTSDGRLLHRYRAGEASITANQDDYAFLIWGLIELYGAAFDANWLVAAIDLTDQVIRHFWDSRAGGFFFTPDDGEDILVRQKPIYDGAVPSGNSVMMYNLIRLARILGNTDYENKAIAISRAFAGEVAQAPLAYTQFLVAADFAIGPTCEVVIAGESDSHNTRQMTRALQDRFLPNMVLLLRPTQEPAPLITRIAPFTREQTSRGGRSTAYVCMNFTCRQPTTDIPQMLEMLR